MRSLIVAAVAGYLAATVAAVAAILAWTRDLETIGVGLLAPLFGLPGLIAYALVKAMPRYGGGRAPFSFYWLAALPWPLYCFALALFPSRGAETDGADHWALAFAIPTVAACVAGYLVLLLWPRVSRVIAAPLAK